MRTRIQAIVLVLVALVVFGLGVPLGRAVAAGEQQRLFLDRLTDTSRFASLAQRSLIEDQPDQLTATLHRYTEVYGVYVVVLNTDLTVLDSSGGEPPTDLSASGFVEQARTGLAGRLPSPGSLLLPWDSAPLTLAEPVRVDGEVRGVVVTVSPTDRTRHRVLVWWLGIAGGGVLVFLLALLAALPVVRWILRPVRRLDEATGALVGAVVGGRPAEPVGDGPGPPELRELSRSFDRMAASVSDALAAQRAFVADASHQLRNPLTALTLRLANLDGHVAAEADEHRAAAATDANRLKHVLDDLLSMARAEGAGAVVPVLVAEPFADRLADWRVVADRQDVRLLVDPVPADGTVLLPDGGLEKILDALLDNALKFSPPDTTVQVGLTGTGTGTGDDDELALTVRDHGPGLTAAELDRATDRFWRSPAHQKVSGSGLGLAIVRTMVERAGGTVALTLPDGGGLAVTVRLRTPRP